ncbi:alpha/beta fold hydrolase [Amycolatopsis suaedae]|uniref:Alpha/beta fold hydrolase n=2 Tax=Amycolatopsis suaedae TaxID=2510978 RepID=A0A4Q7J7P1_9PSEU|nr:alpha/beta fold hydrolase [Amycolatopsis suaedae]
MWAPVQRELALLGHRSYAVDLPGHGFDADYSPHYQAPQDLAAFGAEPSRLAGVTLEDNVRQVVEEVRALSAHGPVVLVASSLGGVTASKVADTVPELVAHVVYVSAWCCVTRPNPVAYMGEPEFAGSLLPGLGGLAVGDPEAIGAGRANYRTADKDLIAALKEATMAEAGDGQWLAFLNIMQPDESMQVMLGDATVHADRWGTVPHTFVRLTGDRSLPIELQDRLIADADRLTPDNPFTVHTVHASHAGFLLKAKEVAAILDGTVASR